MSVLEETLNSPARAFMDKVPGCKEQPLLFREEFMLLENAG